MMEIPNESVNYRNITSEELQQLIQHFKKAIQTLSEEMEKPSAPLTSEMALKITEFVYTIRSFSVTQLTTLWEECMTLEPEAK